jgi:hypothetical protein|tara:strand:+ start:1475 stop:2059 length:585 start_codon:yes stop_codon:yes gene_type:complete
MGLISRTADLFYAFRFLKLLVTPWEKTGAFEQGIVDKDGKNLKKGRDLTTPEEKEVYTVFHRLVFNVKRLLNKLPFGKTKLASYATALFLIKENTGLTEEQIKKVLDEVLEDIDESLNESVFFEKNGVMNPGQYILTESLFSELTGEAIGTPGDKIVISHHTKPIGTMFGTNIYQGHLAKTNQVAYFNTGEIKK